MKSGRQDGIDDIRRAAKLGEPDRYVAALLAPNDVREDLIAIAALSAELHRIGNEVSEAGLCEIKIQWHREALAGALKGRRSGHPATDAVGAALARHASAASLVDDLFDAHVHRLYADAPADDAALMLQLDMTEGAAFRMAALALGAEINARADSAISRAAAAYGLARLGLDLPLGLSRGRNPLPASWSNARGAAEPQWIEATARLCRDSEAALRDCRSLLHGCPAALTTALLPLAVVEPYLAALQRADHDPARDIATIAPLRRVWRIGRAYARSRV